MEVATRLNERGIEPGRLQLRRPTLTKYFCI